MKKNIIMIIMVVAMLMTGCGNKVDESKVAGTETVNTKDELDTNEEAENVNLENKIEDSHISEQDIESMINDELADLNLKEYDDSFEDRDVDTSGKPVFPFENFEGCEDFYYLTDSVNLYIDNGKCIGYTKPNIEIYAIMEYEGWYYVDVSGAPRFVRASDVKANGFEGTKQDYIEATTPVSVPETNPTTPTVVPETPKDNTNPNVEVLPEEPVQTNSKYTPEEAIAVYRSLMEAGGIIWNPELKDVSSWGTGWIYLEKGRPEGTAESNLESFSFGDSVGNPWTQYYLEVTGSDENAVYITEWHN